MCGIAGKFFYNSNQKIDPDLITGMCDKLIHRGPDDFGLFTRNNFGFGMRRLSIIDLQKGHQPIFNEKKNIVIIFNGEIYNYREIKNELIKFNHIFQTNSDTEVILHAYEQYGVDFLHKLNGMFAVAIYNIETNKLILAKDRIGIKPLYYYYDKEKLIFGSEIKAILADPSIEKKLNYKSLDLYLSFGYIPAPHSIFENIYKLPAGYLMETDVNGIKLKKYWDADYQPDYSRSEKDFEEEFLYLLQDSVKLRMISEVPLGAFLSGGVDSSSIVALMSKVSTQPVKTFSIGFKDSPYHDETKYAEMVAERYKTEHTSFYVDSDILNLMDKYIYHFDEPFADYAAFPTYIVSKLAREHVKVVLTGDGGDEIFAGYKRYYAELLADKYKKIPSFVRNGIFDFFINNLKGIIPVHMRFHEYLQFALVKNNMMSMDSDKRYIQSFIHNYFDSYQKSQLYISQDFYDKDAPYKEFLNYWNDNRDYEFLSKRLYLDLKTKLPEDMLTKVDRVSMAVSLEARVPLLDHRIVELAATIPAKYKMNLRNFKRFFKNSVKDVVPKQILSRPKHGFSSPIDMWFRNELSNQVKEWLSSEEIKNAGVFNYSYIHELISKHLSREANNGNKIFTILVFQLWYNKFMRN